MYPLKSYLLILIATLAPPAAHALGGLYSGVEGEQQPAPPEPQEPICGVPLPRPPRDDKIGTARWIVRSLDWGVLSTISTRLVGEYTEDGEEEGGIRGSIPPKPVPFGNVYSYADGTCANSTGIPYLYATSLDQSMIDAQSNPRVSLTLSEASLAGRGVEGAGSSCRATEKGWGDPEMPPCVRLTITGELKRLSLEDEDGGGEADFAVEALMEKHPSDRYWPQNHKPFAAKIIIEDIWLLDWYGGASVLDPGEYLSYGGGIEEEEEEEAI